MTPSPETSKRKRFVASGVLVIDKPRGPTSHDVVARLRKALGTREVGHAGTLDPMATGVLVVAIGEATKLVPYLTSAKKSYEATIALGVETDTLDAEGRESQRAPLSASLRTALAAFTNEQGAAPEVVAALEAERARTMQVPPQFSAIKQNGERAHAKARRGEAFELAARAVHVDDLRVLGTGDDECPWLAISLSVSKGYYVRSLARDLAASLGTVGHLTALRRTRSGCFIIGEALALDTAADELEARIVPLAHAATRALPRATLSETGLRDARHGRLVGRDQLDPSLHEPGAPHAWLSEGGTLVAIGEMREDGGHVLRGFQEKASQ